MASASKTGDQPAGSPGKNHPFDHALSFFYVLSFQRVGWRRSCGVRGNGTKYGWALLLKAWLHPLSSGQAAETRIGERLRSVDVTKDMIVGGWCILFSNVGLPYMDSPNLCSHLDH